MSSDDRCGSDKIRCDQHMFERRSLLAFRDGAVALARHRKDYDGLVMIHVILDPNSVASVFVREASDLKTSPTCRGRAPSTIRRPFEM